MANEFVKNRWILDTASPNMVTTERLCVKAIRWVYEGASAGDNASLQDLNGKILWESSAAGANHIEEALQEDIWPLGFKIPTLSGGRVIITLE